MVGVVGLDFDSGRRDLTDHEGVESMALMS